jgi:hypothetical protein
LPGHTAWPYHRRFGAHHSMGTAPYRLRPTACLRGPTVDESNCRTDPGVQDVAAALLGLGTSGRRPFIRPLLALIQRATAESTGTVSAPVRSASRDLHSHVRTSTPDVDEAELAPMQPP